MVALKKFLEWLVSQSNLNSCCLNKFHCVSAQVESPFLYLRSPTGGLYFYHHLAVCKTGRAHVVANPRLALSALRKVALVDGVTSPEPAVRLGRTRRTTTSVTPLARGFPWPICRKNLHPDDPRSCRVARSGERSSLSLEQYTSSRFVQHGGCSSPANMLPEIRSYQEMRKCESLTTSIK